MKLYDVEHRHFVASVSGDVITSRHGHRFIIEGYAVLGSDGEVVGSFDEGRFYNFRGTLMAAERERNA